MSVRASTPSPRICSGAIVYDVPSRVPTTVNPPSPASGCNSLAMPKSSSLMTRWPFTLAMKMLLALRSRWTMPRSCAACSAEQTGSRISSTSPGGQIVELEDVDDARVLDHVDGARFLHEPRDHLGRRGELAPQHLDRRAPAEDPVVGLVHGPAAARGELLLEDVGAGQC